MGTKAARAMDVRKKISNSLTSFIPIFKQTYIQIKLFDLASKNFQTNHKKSNLINNNNFVACKRLFGGAQCSNTGVKDHCWRKRLNRAPFSSYLVISRPMWIRSVQIVDGVCPKLMSVPTDTSEKLRVSFTPFYLNILYTKV